LLIRYENKKIRFLSKNWFNYKFLKIRYYNISKLFVIANLSFVKKSNKIANIKNKNIKNLISEIKKTNDTIFFLAKNGMQLNENSNRNDIINFYIYLISCKYNEKRHNNLVKKLRKNLNF
jgi:hypothetical protein